MSPPGAEDEAADVLGKLDELLNRHKPRPADPESAAVPTLSDAFESDPPPDPIPTLTDAVHPLVQRPAREVSPAAGIDAALVRRLAMRLEVERARLLAEAPADADRARMLDELVSRLRDSLSDIVQVALDREERRASPRSEADR